MSSYSDYATDLKLTELRNFCFYLSPQNILQERHQIQKSLDRNAFFPIYTLPLDIQLLFTNTPINDTDTFKFILLMYGNNAPPDLTFRHLCTSYFQDKSITKRLLQIKWITTNLHKKCTTWYYFDIPANRFLHLNGQYFRTQMLTTRDTIYLFIFSYIHILCTLYTLQRYVIHTISHTHAFYTRVFNTI